MHRIVDVERALTGRTYASGLRIDAHVDVTDAAAPWNAGRYRLLVEDGCAELTRGGSGTIALGINALSALAAGAASASQLARAGMLEVDNTAQLDALDAIFGAPFPETLDDF